MRKTLEDIVYYISVVLFISGVIIGAFYFSGILSKDPFLSCIENKTSWVVIDRIEKDESITIFVWRNPRIKSHNLILGIADCIREEAPRKYKNIYLYWVNMGWVKDVYSQKFVIGYINLFFKLPVDVLLGMPRENGDVYVMGFVDSGRVIFQQFNPYEIPYLSVNPYHLKNATNVILRPVPTPTPVPTKTPEQSAQ